jgi:hypothetical protein
VGFFDKLFKKQEPVPVTQEIDKAQVPVYPMIKSAEWRGIAHAASLPFVAVEGQPHLAIVFAQDAGDRFEYITPGDLQKPGVQENYDKWQSNINNYPHEITLAEVLDNKVATSSGEDHSAEKILSSAFLAEACQALKTDKLIISAPRRRCLMITSYYGDFNLLEDFFRLHFKAWNEDEYGNEPITEMVFLADKDKVTHAVPLGFRINVYEKDGQFTLSYSTMDELFDENGQVNFQSIMERNKIPVTL